MDTHSQPGKAKKLKRSTTMWNRMMSLMKKDLTEIFRRFFDRNDTISSVDIISSKQPKEEWTVLYIASKLLTPITIYLEGSRESLVVIPISISVWHDPQEDARKLPLHQIPGRFAIFFMYDGEVGVEIGTAFIEDINIVHQEKLEKTKIERKIDL
jgi:hypothetical protein